MNVLVLTREYPPDVYGGAGVHVEYLVRELARLARVEVRTFGHQALESNGLAVRGHGAAAAAPDEAPAPFTPVLRALRVGLSFAGRPSAADVVHCHTWYAHFGGLLVRQLHGIPLVVTAHSLEPLRPWKREQLGRGADVAAWVERLALESADAVVAVSGEMRGDVLRHFRVPPERVHVIPNGVDVETYRRVPGRTRLDRFGIDPARPYVLFVGRVSRQKGLSHLIRAIPDLDPHAQVVLCAGAPDTRELGLEVAAAVARVQAARPGVIWIPEMVDRATAVALYSHAAVFCCPSVYEPFGLINLEAMACEVPVVATAVGGIPEVVVDGETGCLVPVELGADGEPRDPAAFVRALAGALNALLADPDRRRAMGLAGRRRAESRFSWAAVARRTLDLYAELRGDAR
jgi:glycogen synthase